MKKKIRRLPWDSEFFGFPVARIVGQEITIKDLEELYRSSNYKLIYFFTTNTLPNALLEHDFFTVKLVDSKVPIRKTLNKNAKLHPKISIYKSLEVKEEFIALAQRAGTYSRFRKDDLIPNAKFQELYRIWITKSIQGSMADIILVYKDNTKIVGFTSINTKSKEPHVVLLAVAPEYEGKGVSFALMSAIENVLISKGFNAIWSETQGDNHKALSIYRRHGLEIGRANYIYHLWRKN